MPEHDCTKADKIDNIAHTLERMEESQKSIVELLQKVANQDARLDHLEEHAENSYRDINEVFGRTRLLEIQNGKIDTLITIASNKYFVTVTIGLVIMTAIGSVLDIIFHYDTFKKFLPFLG